MSTSLKSRTSSPPRKKITGSTSTTNSDITEFSLSSHFLLISVIAIAAILPFLITNLVTDFDTSTLSSLLDPRPYIPLLPPSLLQGAGKAGVPASATFASACFTYFAPEGKVKETLAKNAITMLPSDFLVLTMAMGGIGKLWEALTSSSSGKTDKNDPSSEILSIAFRVSSYIGFGVVVGIYVTNVIEDNTAKSLVGVFLILGGVLALGNMVRSSSSSSGSGKTAVKSGRNKTPTGSSTARGRSRSRSRGRKSPSKSPTKRNKSPKASTNNTNSSSSSSNTSTTSSSSDFYNSPQFLIPFGLLAGLATQIANNMGVLINLLLSTCLKLPKDKSVGVRASIFVFVGVFRIVAGKGVKWFIGGNKSSSSSSSSSLLQSIFDPELIYLIIFTILGVFVGKVIVRRISEKMFLWLNSYVSIAVALFSGGVLLKEGVMAMQ